MSLIDHPTQKPNVAKKIGTLAKAATWSSLGVLFVAGALTLAVMDSGQHWITQSEEKLEALTLEAQGQNEVLQKERALGPAERLAFIRQWMSEGFEADPMLEQEISQRLKAYQGLPVTELTAWKMPANINAGSGSDGTYEKLLMQSSVAFEFAGGPCAVVMKSTAQGYPTGGSASDLKALQKIYQPLGAAAWHEMDVLHEIGHCQAKLNTVAFNHPGLSPSENEKIAHQFLSLTSPSGLDGAGSIAIRLWQENRADGFAAVKWMEARGFSEESTTMIKLRMNERRLDPLVLKNNEDPMRVSGRSDFNSHFTQNTLEQVLLAKDALKVMSPAEREQWLNKTVSVVLVNSLMNAQELQDIVPSIVSPEAISTRIAFDAALNAIRDTANPEWKKRAAHIASASSRGTAFLSDEEIKREDLKRYAQNRAEELLAQKEGGGGALLKELEQGDPDQVVKAYVMEMVTDELYLNQVEQHALKDESAVIMGLLQKARQAGFSPLNVASKTQGSSAGTSSKASTLGSGIQENLKAPLKAADLLIDRLSSYRQERAINAHQVQVEGDKNDDHLKVQDRQKLSKS